MASEECDVAVLTSQYVDEFGRRLCALRRFFDEEVLHRVDSWGNHIDGLQEVINRCDVSLVDALAERRSLEEAEMRKLVSTFTWASVLLLAMGVAGVLSRCLLGLVVGIFLSKITLAVLVFGFVPLVVVYAIGAEMEDSQSKDEDGRHLLLLFAVTEGLLTGRLYSSWYLPGWAPLPALNAVAIVVVARYGSNFYERDRVKLLAAALGSGLVLHLLGMFLLGPSIAYVVLSLLYTFAAFVSLQIYFSVVNKPIVLTHACHMSLVCAVLFADAWGMVLSSDGDDLGGGPLDVDLGHTPH